MTYVTKDILEFVIDSDKNNNGYKFQTAPDISVIEEFLKTCTIVN